MQALRLPGKVNEKGQLVLDDTGDLPPGRVEVILLYPELGEAGDTDTDDETHPARGIWSDIPAERSSADIAAELRLMLETRGDQRG